MMSARKRSMESVSSLSYAPPKAGRHPNPQAASGCRLAKDEPLVGPTEATPKPRAAPPKKAWPMSPMARPARGGFAEAQSPPRRRPRLVTQAFAELVGHGPDQDMPKNHNEKMKFFEAAINQGEQQCIQMNSIGHVDPGFEPCIFGSITDFGGGKSFLRIPVSAIEVVTNCRP